MYVRASTRGALPGPTALFPLLHSAWRHHCDRHIKTAAGAAAAHSQPRLTEECRCVTAAAFCEIGAAYNRIQRLLRSAVRAD